MRIELLEGAAPEIGDNAMLMTNPVNPPPSKAEEEKAAKAAKGPSCRHARKAAKADAAKAETVALHKAKGKGEKTAAEATA